MLRHLFILVTALLLANPALADDTMVVIKVNGAYGIINKGTNQGVQKGQILYVKRITASGPVDVGKVKVIRTTANRAAVEQMTSGREPILRKDDRLYLENENDFPIVTSDTAVSQTRKEQEEKREPAAPKPETEEAKQTAYQPRAEPVESSRKPVQIEEEYKHRIVSDRLSNLKKPWITLNTGAVFPYNNFATAYNGGLMLGASYMVSAGNDFHVGLEVNKTFFGESPSANSANLGFTPNSGSLLEALFVVQRFFGTNFFFELGGGIYRPKIRITSVDNVESAYSETNFGFFGGTGFFIPTSPYAGVALKGRLHNYFDNSNRQYYGLSGGFRFKIR